MFGLFSHVSLHRYTQGYSAAGTRDTRRSSTRGELLLTTMPCRAVQSRCRRKSGQPRRRHHSNLAATNPLAARLCVSPRASQHARPSASSPAPPTRATVRAAGVSSGAPTRELHCYRGETESDAFPFDCQLADVRQSGASAHSKKPAPQKAWLPPNVTSIPSPPPSGTSTSAVMVNDCTASNPP